MINPLKLGKRAYRHDPRRRALAALVLPKLPLPPESRDWTNGHPAWGMMRNDVEGDCVFAGGGHIIQVATLQATDAMVTPPDEQIEAMYEQWAGFKPDDPATDNGFVEADFLNLWEQQGYCGFKLLGHVDVNPANLTHVKQASAFFGPLKIGANLPVSAQSQTLWDVAIDDGGLWGGHDMTLAAYDKAGPLLITWGAVQRATWAWWLKYVDECHALLLEVWEQRFPSAGSDVLQRILKAVA